MRWFRRSGSCGECRWSAVAVTDDTEEPVLLCQRFPPQLVFDGVEVCQMFPEGLEPCGEWTAA